jgi:hypothetical protein
VTLEIVAARRDEDDDAWEPGFAPSLCENGVVE